MLYMLLICYDSSEPSDGTNRQPEHAKLEAELREKGSYVSGAALWPLAAAKSIQGKVDDAFVLDGPFAESKEVIGGYFIVDADEEEAIAIARRIPRDSRSWIQVRPIALFHPNAIVMPKLEGYVDSRLLQRS